jgi:hypothetical protein
MGAPSVAHSQLTKTIWQSRAKHYEGNEQLVFSHDGQFVNGIVPDDGNELAPVCEGDWMLSDSTLTLLTTHANFEDAADIMWKELRYEVLTLDGAKLCYKEEDGTQWEYTSIDATS